MHRKSMEVIWEDDFEDNMNLKVSFKKQIQTLLITAAAG